MTQFKREDRYSVTKHKDIDWLPPDHPIWYHLAKVKDYANEARQQSGKHGPLECVVVESDWSIYDTVWNLVEEEYNNG